MDLQSYYIYIYSSIFLVLFLVIVSTILSNSFGNKTLHKKLDPYECGFSPSYTKNTSKIYFSYFQVSLVFLIFDLEVLYLFPWVITAKYFLFNGLFFFLFFFFILIIILVIGILYEYMSGILDWR